MKIKYVGVKADGETAFALETKIERWMLGDSHEIADAELAARMLKHPDVFALDEAKAAKAPAPTAAPVAPVVTLQAGEATAPAGGMLAPGTAVAPVAAADPLADLDDAGVRAYAKAQGLKLQGIGLLKADNLRAKVKAALAEKK